VIFARFEEAYEMTPLTNPVVGRKRLRTALRRAREASGRTQEQVAGAMDWSLSKVIRIETGAVGVSTNDMKALLQLYEIEDPAQVSGLVELARASRQRPWWTAHRDLDDVFTHFLGLEAGASGIQMFQMAAVPGLFQTERYAVHVSGDFWIGDQPSATEVAERVAVRLTRQREVLDRADPPDITAVIDEAVLRHVVGDAEIMAEQLRRLADLARRPNIAMRVLPFTAGVSPYLSSFVILGFPDPEDTDVVYLERAIDQAVTEDPRQTDQYHGAFERLWERTLPPQKSIAMIKQVADEL
jgi:transcriptional regulator with XRE-family HTH domain